MGNLQKFNDFMDNMFLCVQGDDNACEVMDKLHDELGLNEVPYKEGD